MWYYLPEWLRFWKRWEERKEAQRVDQNMSEIIKRRAAEQNAILERKAEEEAKADHQPQKKSDQM